jgi:hypothetical protein
MSYYYAWGDIKMMCSSEEEGYENHVLEARGKRRGHALGTSGEAVSKVETNIWRDLELKKRKVLNSVKFF